MIVDVVAQKAVLSGQPAVLRRGGWFFATLRVMKCGMKQRMHGLCEGDSVAQLDAMMMKTFEKNSEL